MEDETTHGKSLALFQLCPCCVQSCLQRCEVRAQRVPVNSGYCACIAPSHSTDGLKWLPHAIHTACSTYTHIYISRYNSIFQDKRIIDAHTLRSVEKERAAGSRSCRRRILVMSPATFFTMCRAYITVRTVPDQDEPWQHGAAYSSRPSWRPVYRNGFRRLSAAVRTGESARSQESPPQAPPEALPRSAADAHRLTIISRLGPDMIIKRSDREPLLHWGREAAPYTRTEHHEW